MGTTMKVVPESSPIHRIRIPRHVKSVIPEKQQSKKLKDSKCLKKASEKSIHVSTVSIATKAFEELSHNCSPMKECQHEIENKMISSESKQLTDINSKYYKIFRRQEIEVSDSKKALSTKEHDIKKLSELEKNCRKKGLDLSPDVMLETLSSDTENLSKKE